MNILADSGFIFFRPEILSLVLGPPYSSLHICSILQVGQEKCAGNETNDSALHGGGEGEIK